MARSAGGELIPLEPVREPAPQAPVPAPDAGDALNLRDLLMVAYRRKWIIVVFLAVVLSLVVVWLMRTPRIYQATATIEISPTPPRYLGSGVQEVAETGANFYWQSREYLETQFQIIRSRAVAQRVVEKTGLAQDASFVGAADIADPALRAKRMASADPVAMVQGAITVSPVKDSRIVRLSVEDKVPERAMRLANALAEAYIEQNLDRKLDTTRAASRWLADQLDGLKEKLEQSEVKLYDFKRENDILTASFEDRQNIVSARLVAVNDALTRLGTRKAELEARMSTLRDAKKRVGAGELDALEVLAPIATSALISSLKLRLLQVEEERADLATRYLDKHPRRAAAEERVQQVRAALQREIDKLVRVAETEYRETTQTAQELRTLIDAAKREQFELNKRLIDYTKLKREQENNQRLYDLVLQRLKEADLSGMLRTNNVQMLDSARVPGSPVRPNRRLILMMAVLVGLVGGFGLAVLLERADNTVKSPDDVEKLLRLPFLGVVPTISEEGQDQLPAAERARNRDLHAHRRPKSSVAESVRNVRTNLLFMTPDKPFKRLLITSAGPREGKTTVAINLAITMAQAGSRTLVIDTDMRRPRIHRPFGITNDVGISSLVVGSARIEDAVRETPVPNLYVLACGPLPPNPAELVHTARFKQVLAELDQRFDRIILDSPPVAAVTDALILSADVDGVVLVVKAGTTPKDVAARIKRSLVDVNANIFGVVVNDLDLGSRTYGYYYYYYQRYQYGYGEKGADKA